MSDLKRKDGEAWNDAIKSTCALCLMAGKENCPCPCHKYERERGN